MWAVYPTLSQTVFDCTLELAHVDAMGHLSIDLLSQGDFPATSTVDVFDDGVVDAALPTSGSANSITDVHVALPLSLVPTRVRIRLTASVPAPIFHHVEVRWQPWVPSAQDLGSACGPNPLHPGTHENYFLAALPGTGGNAVDFVAHGWGAGVFLVALHPRRLPTGTFGFPYGCDDLLAAPVLTAPGTLLAPGQWSLPVPPLPPGLQFFVQHVSQGTSHLGATNLIAYGT